MANLSDLLQKSLGSPRTRSRRLSLVGTKVSSEPLPPLYPNVSWACFDADDPLARREGWFFWTAPYTDPIGPFDTHDEAIDAAELFT